MSGLKSPRGCSQLTRVGHESGMGTAKEELFYPETHLRALFSVCKAVVCKTAQHAKIWSALCSVPCCLYMPCRRVLGAGSSLGLISRSWFCYKLDMMVRDTSFENPGWLTWWISLTLHC